MGQNVLRTFLENIPGINAPVLQQQLTNIKASGDDARLIAEVEADITRDHPEALEAMRRHARRPRLARCTNLPQRAAQAARRSTAGAWPVGAPAPTPCAPYRSLSDLTGRTHRASSRWHVHKSLGSWLLVMRQGC